MPDVPSDLTAMLGAIPEPVAAFDGSGEFLASNGAWETLLGKIQLPAFLSFTDFGAALGRLAGTAIELGYQEDPAGIEFMLESGTCVSYRTTWYADQNLIVWLNDVSQQATNRRLTEELESFVKGGAWNFDLQSRELHFSDGAWAVFGEKASEELSTIDTWLEHVGPEDRIELDRKMAHTMQTLEP